MMADSSTKSSSGEPDTLENHMVWHADRGFPLPSMVTQRQLDLMKTMDLYSDDVWVATYPRSGTTWTQQIVRSIRSQCYKNLQIDELRITLAIPFLEAANSDFIPYKIDLATMDRPRAFKSHMPYDRMPCGLPKDTPCKYIYVARNPKDMAVSYFYHYFSTKAAENMTFDKFFSALFSGQVYYGDYFEHVLSWWEHKDDDNVLFLKYEDLKNDTKAAIVKIADFIEVKLTEEAIESVLEMSSFSSMRQNPTTNYEWIPPKMSHPSKTPFIRKGVVGGWKDHFTSEQSSMIDALYCEKITTVGLEFDFD